MRVRSSAIIILSVLLLGQTCLFGEDLDALLKAVDKVEANLNKVVLKETADRKQETRQLREDIRQLRQMLGSALDSLSKAQPKAELRLPTAQAGQPTDTSASPAITREQWVSLVAEVAALKAESAQLREQILGGPAQYASTDETAVISGSQESLVSKVQSLSDRLEQFVHQKNQPIEVGQSVKPGIDLFGFVTASNHTDPSTRTNSFSLDQVNADIQKSFLDRASLRADIECLNDGKGGFTVGLEQGYVSWSVGHNWKWQFTFGRFNAPLGFEAVDPINMYQFSYGLVTAHCVPANLTGVMASLTTPKLVDWSVFVVNGWDVNFDNNSGKTVGAHIGFTPSKNLNWTIAALTGPELNGNDSSCRTVLDWDLTYKPQAFWIVGAEFNIGWETKVLADNRAARWNGILLMNNFQFGQRFGLTLRADYLNDLDGSRTGSTQEQKAVCISPSVKIADGLSGRFEARYDWSNHRTYADGSTTRSDLSSTALEFIYGF